MLIVRRGEGAKTRPTNRLCRAPLRAARGRDVQRALASMDRSSLLELAWRQCARARARDYGNIIATTRDERVVGRRTTTVALLWWSVQLERSSSARRLDQTTTGRPGSLLCLSSLVLDLTTGGRGAQSLVVLCAWGAHRARLHAGDKVQHYGTPLSAPRSKPSCSTTRVRGEVPERRRL